MGLSGNVGGSVDALWCIGVIPSTSDDRDGGCEQKKKLVDEETSMMQIGEGIESGQNHVQR